MSRSVSVPCHAAIVCYVSLGYDDDPDAAQENFDCDIDNLKSELKAKYPSLYDEDKWLDREDHVILANNHCYIGVSEYCGLMSVWLLPRDSDNEPLSARWIISIEDGFKNLVNGMFGSGALVKLGSMSNGEGVFKRIQQESP